MSKFFNFFKSLSSNFRERKKERVKPRFSRLVFNLASGLTVGLLVGVVVLAFNNPVGNPPTGTGAIGVGSGAPANSIYVDSAGEVGIGTATPGAKFDVAGTVQLRGAGGADGLRVRSNGNAFIGPFVIGEPSQKLVIEGGTAGGAADIFLHTSSGGSYSLIKFGAGGAAASTRYMIGEDNSGNGALYLRRGDDFSTGATTMTLDGTGNVGIGKTPGGYALDVNGNVNATAYYGSGANLTGIMGSRVARAASTAYQANTDGYVNGFVVAANGIATITGYSDSSNPPTTIIDKDGYWAGGGGDVGASVGFFVKKNDYWRVVVSSSGYLQTITVWWTPLGS